MQVQSTLTSDLRFNPPFLPQVLGRQGASRHRNSERTRNSCMRTDASPERTTVNVTPQSEGPADYVPSTTRIVTPTAATAILATGCEG